MRIKFWQLFSALLLCLGVSNGYADVVAPTTTESLTPVTPATPITPVTPISPVSPNYEGAFVKMLVTLLALLLLVFLTFWLIRKMSHGRLSASNANRSIKILEKRPISAKSMLYLIQIDNKKILMAESQLEVRKIESVEEDEED